MRASGGRNRVPCTNNSAPNSNGKSANFHVLSLNGGVLRRLGATPNRGFGETQGW